MKATRCAALGADGVVGPMTYAAQPRVGHRLRQQFPVEPDGHGAPLRGDKGSVRKLVPIANERGFYWGGRFSRRDGMHFELAQLP